MSVRLKSTAAPPLRHMHSHALSPRARGAPGVLPGVPPCNRNNCHEPKEAQRGFPSVMHAGSSGLLDRATMHALDAIWWACIAAVWRSASSTGAVSFSVAEAYQTAISKVQTTTSRMHDSHTPLQSLHGIPACDIGLYVSAAMIGWSSIFINIIT